MGGHLQNHVAHTNKAETALPYRKFSRITLRFRMSFYTKWGENLLICGSDSLFGSGDVKKGMWMTPHHEGEDLVWYAVVSVPDGFKMDYKYYIVDEQRNALKWEALESRSLKLPKGLEDGLSVDVVDTWVVRMLAL